jgi:multiple sugar transport system substrate-binding protein
MMRGKRVGMPKYINIMTITVNTEMFDEYGVALPPADGNWDHDDYAEMVMTLTEAARTKGNDGIWGGWIPAWAWDRFWNHIHMFGGKIVDEKYGKKCLLGEPEAQAAMQWLYDLEWTKNYNAQPGQVENQWFRNAMNAGFVMSCESGTYPINTDRDFEGKVKWDMRHVPQGPAGRSVLGTTDAWSITKQTKNADASWELLKFLSGPVFQFKAVVSQEGIIPVLKSLQSDFIAKVREIRPSLNDVRLETITEAFEWGYPEDSPWFDKQTEAVQLITPALEKIFTVGDAGPEYFIEVAKEIDATQV